MEQLAYISTAASGLREDDVQAILRRSRHRNPARHITGYLLYRGGYFLQVLEGPAAALDELLAWLLRDPRHADLQVLYRQTTARRTFAAWSMGYTPGSDPLEMASLRQKLLRLRESGRNVSDRVVSLLLSLLNKPPSAVAG